jgi:hypothetical protein
MDGVGLRDVQLLMGHKGIAMTCRYSHLAPSHQLAAIRRLDGWGKEPRMNEKQTGTTIDTSLSEAVQQRVKSEVQVIVQ